MTKDEIEFLLKEHTDKIHVEYDQKIRALEERMREIEKAHSHTVLHLTRRITQLGG